MATGLLKNPWLKMMDRRSGTERRNSQRHRVTVDLDWENHTGRHPGTMSDISENGCFVLTAGDFADGERVYIHLPSEGTEPVRVAGEITNNVYEIGFAATFSDVDTKVLVAIRKFIETDKSQT